MVCVYSSLSSLCNGCRFGRTSCSQPDALGARGVRRSFLEGAGLIPESRRGARRGLMEKGRRSEGDKMWRVQEGRESGGRGKKENPGRAGCDLNFHFHPHAWGCRGCLVPGMCPIGFSLLQQVSLRSVSPDEIIIIINASKLGGILHGLGLGSFLPVALRPSLRIAAFNERKEGVRPPGSPLAARLPGAQDPSLLRPLPAVGFLKPAVSSHSDGGPTLEGSRLVTEVL